MAEIEKKGVTFDDKIFTQIYLNHNNCNRGTKQNIKTRNQKNVRITFE